MSAGIVVRPIAAADLAPLMTIAATLGQVPRWPLTSWQQAILPPHIALAAVDYEEAIAGFAVTAVMGQFAELETLAVVPARRRQGIARLLLASAIEKLRSSAVPELWLEVRVSNHAAIRLYRSLGFEETGRRPLYYTAPVEDALLMCLALRS